MCLRGVRPESRTGGAGRQSLADPGYGSPPGWHSRKVVEVREMQINRLFCKPICKPDAAGQAETGETQKVREDFAEKID